MSGGPTIPPSGDKGGAPDGYDIPVPTSRVLESLNDKFAESLLLLAKAKTAQRKSKTVTDADANDAFEDLTRRSKTPKAARCLGALGLVAGGWLLRTDVGVVIAAGIAVCVFAVYIREFHGNE